MPKTPALQPTTTSVLASWPRLDDWVGPRANHPLRVGYEGLPAQHAVLGVFEDVIVFLEASGTPGLQGKSKQLRTATSWQECLDVRTELLIAAKLNAAAIPFEFLLANSTPRPDIEIHNGELRLEVTNRWVPGRGSLVDALEEQIAGTGCSLSVTCSTQPARITDDQRSNILAAVAAELPLGAGFTVVKDLAGTGGNKVTLTITGEPGAPGTEAVIWEVVSAELTEHLDDVEAYLRNKLTDVQKNAQAASAPTVLVIEASRTGDGWMRPNWVWQGKLQSLLDTTSGTNFIGVMLVFTDMVSRDLRAISACSSSATQRVQGLLEEVRAALATAHP